MELFSYRTEKVEQGWEDVWECTLDPTIGFLMRTSYVRLSFLDASGKVGST